MRGAKKSWMDNDLTEDWVRVRDSIFEGQNRKVLLIVANCLAYLEIADLDDPFIKIRSNME